jgi:capsular exopolysaccharide synthesis family protein
MGRVEEAMRRAAAGSAAAPPAAQDSESPIDPTDFPTELPAGAGGAAALDEAPAGAGTAGADAAAAAAVAEWSGEPKADVAPQTAGTGFGAGAPGAGGAASGQGMATKLVGDDRMLTTSREQYRRLAATLHHIQGASGIKVVLVASAVAGEGKTLTAANLALTFSESYERQVLLIDADLRRPSLARTFGIPPSPGLSEGLMQIESGPLPVQQITARLSVLPAGRPTPDPMAGLTSVRMRELIQEARQTFDWVIIDTPPVGLMTDANLLSAIADGTVLVVKANSTPYHLVQRAIDALGREQLLGAVLNRATEQHRGDKYYDYYKYGYGYGYAPRPDAAPPAQQS